jgi:hypothetical protein
MFIVDIGFSLREEPLLIMREAYTHIVSIGSAACQKPLGTMREAFGDNVKSYSADCSAVTIRKNYPPIHHRQSLYTSAFEGSLVYRGIVSRKNFPSL